MVRRLNGNGLQAGAAHRSNRNFTETEWHRGYYWPARFAGTRTKRRNGSGVQLIDPADKISVPSGQAFDAASLKPLSVAIYVQDLAPGDVERQCLVLARELAARDVAVTLVVHRLVGTLLPLLPDCVPVVDLNGRRTLSDVLGLRRYLLDARPDVLVANVDHINVAASIAEALAGPSTKLVICQHNPLIGYHTTVRWSTGLPSSATILSSARRNRLIIPG